MAQLAAAAAQNNKDYTASATQDVTKALKDLVTAAYGVVATSSEPQAQTAVFDSTQSVLDDLSKLFSLAKGLGDGPAQDSKVGV